MDEMCDSEKCLDNKQTIKKQMLTPQNAKEASNMLKLLAHPTRLQILRILSNADQCVCEFSVALGKRQPNVSQHLAKLKDSRIIDSYMKGKYAYYTLKNKKILTLVKSL